MRMRAIGAVVCWLLGCGGIAFAQPALPLAGQTCIATLPHSVIKHTYVARNGALFVHAWSKVPYGANANVFVNDGESAVTINSDGSLQFMTGHYRTSVVPRGTGKWEVTLAGTRNVSTTAAYDSCAPSS
jgi:hypothetical protein